MNVRTFIGVAVLGFALSSYGSVLAQNAAPSAGTPQNARAAAPASLPANAMNAVENLPPEMRSFGLGPKPILIEPASESLEERLKTTITLDVREMNVIDVLKFLALKGNFNLVTSNTVVGRVTIYLKNVSIQDGLDIVLIANNLAYNIEKDIVHVMSQVEFEAMFGRKFKDKMRVEIIQLKYAKPSYVLSALDNVKSSLGRIIIDEDTGSIVLIDTDESLRKMKDVIAEIETPLESVVYALQYAKADVVAEKLRARIDANAVGSLTMDERSNQIIVRALPERREEVLKMIRTLDVPTKEVLVEARILQVVFKPQFDFGIDWEFDFQNTPFGELRKFDVTNTFTNSNTLSRFFKLTGGAVATDDFTVTIRALKQVSDTKILSNPKILVTNNEEAKIHIGDTVPYIISTTSGTGDNAITSEDVRFVDVGLKLNVTPTINDDGFVTMRLAPEISTVTTSIQSQGGGIPQVNKTLVETTVIVKDGETIVLGGLKKDNKVHTRQGVPVLMDIPIVRKLFSSTAESFEATEIVIFITPHIIKDFKNYGQFEGELKPAQEFQKPEAKTSGKTKNKIADDPSANPGRAKRAELEIKE